MTWLDDLVVFAQGRLDERVRSALWGRGVTDEQMDLYRIGHLNSILPSLPMPEAKEFCEWARVDGRIDDVFVLPRTNSRRSIPSC
jgi:hypothetical protein